MAKMPWICAITDLDYGFAMLVAANNGGFLIKLVLK